MNGLCMGPVLIRSVVPWDLMGEIDRKIPFKSKHSKIFYVLHDAWLWLSIFVPFYHRRKHIDPWFLDFSLSLFDLSNSKMIGFFVLSFMFYFAILKKWLNENLDTKEKVNNEIVMYMPWERESKFSPLWWHWVPQTP